MKFSYVICHRASSECRASNLEALVSYLRFYYGSYVEIIVVEQDSTKSNILDIDKHLLLEDDGLFRRATTLNMGVYAASNEVVFVADNDVILSKMSIDACISNCLDGYDISKPYSKIYDVPSEPSECFKKTLRVSSLLSESSTLRDSTCIAGGGFATNRSAFLKMKGYDERFVGWGGEDDLLSIKIDKLCKSIVVDGVAYHLYHERSENNGMPHHREYDNNVNILIYVRSLSDDELMCYMGDMGWC